MRAFFIALRSSEGSKVKPVCGGKPAASVVITGMLCCKALKRSLGWVIMTGAG